MNTSISLQRCGVVNRKCKFMIMKKIYLLLLLTIISIPAYARGEIYAWHELNNTGDTSLISFIFGGIICLFLGVLFLGGWLNDVFKGECKKESNEIGCMGLIFLLILILGIIVRIHIR